jgi:sugar (pentulose or hexulose) kinase
VDYAAALATMTGPGKNFEPIGENVALYDDLYKRVYKKMYPQWQSLYREVRDITGYPA